MQLGICYLNFALAAAISDCLDRGYNKDKWWESNKPFLGCTLQISNKHQVITQNSIWNQL